MSIRKGVDWGRELTGSIDVDLAGGDADLSGWLRQTAIEKPLVRLTTPESADIARSVGIGDRSTERGRRGALSRTEQREVALDLIALEDGRRAVNMVVIGTSPRSLRRSTHTFHCRLGTNGRWESVSDATTIVIAVGQFLDGLDLSPRGHPGDGRCEIIVFSVRAGERRELRKRLASGTHVPHPDILERRARRVQVKLAAPAPFEIDGESCDPVMGIDASVITEAYRLVV